MCSTRRLAPQTQMGTQPLITQSTHQPSVGWANWEWTTKPQVHTQNELKQDGGWSTLDMHTHTHTWTWTWTYTYIGTVQTLGVIRLPFITIQLLGVTGRHRQTETIWMWRWYTGTIQTWAGQNKSDYRYISMTGNNLFPKSVYDSFLLWKFVHPKVFQIGVGNQPLHLQSEDRLC